MTTDMSGNDFAMALAAAKEGLSFGEVAWALGLKGSSRRGWDCPACCAREAILERPDHKGGRCINKACNKGYDAPGLIMTARGVSARTALTVMERIIAERDARAAGEDGGPGLFGGEVGMEDGNGREEA